MVEGEVVVPGLTLSQFEPNRPMDEADRTRYREIAASTRIKGVKSPD
jgi:hypothetical protein